MRHKVLDRACVASASFSGMDTAASHWPCVRAERGDHPPMEARALARAKKNAAIRRQTIVFVDESGLSERPHRERTWAPRGQTPVLQFHFNWKTLSAIAGVTWWNFYFRLFPGAIRSHQVLTFLTHLLRHIQGNVLVIWDGLRQHRSKRVKDFVSTQHGRLELEFVPAYAPELDPVEYLWGIGRPMNCQTSVHTTSGSSVQKHVVHCVACADVPHWSVHSGSRLASLIIVTALCKAQ